LGGLRIVIVIIVIIIVIIIVVIVVVIVVVDVVRESVHSRQRIAVFPLEEGTPR